MDRTIKEILDTYNRGSLDQKHYILSTSVTGDLRKRAMRDLTKRFRKVQRTDPQSIPNGIRDLKLMDKPNVSNDTKQALHTIRQSSKGLGSTLGVDELLAQHFAGHITTGLLTNTLAGGSLQLVHQHLKRQHQNDLKMQKASDNKNKQRQERMSPKKASPSSAYANKNQNPEDNMNQTNVRRKSEEHNEQENDLARKRKLKRMRALRAQRAKQQRMHF